jgi:hypothetical protein
MLLKLSKKSISTETSCDGASPLELTLTAINTKLSCRTITNEWVSCVIYHNKTEEEKL